MTKKLRWKNPKLRDVGYKEVNAAICLTGTSADECTNGGSASGGLGCTGGLNATSSCAEGSGFS